MSKLSLRKQADEIISNDSPVEYDPKAQIVRDLLNATISLETELMKMHRMGIDAYKAEVKLSKFEAALKQVNAIGKELSDTLFFSTMDLFE